MDEGTKPSAPPRRIIDAADALRDPPQAGRLRHEESGTPFPPAATTIEEPLDRFWNVGPEFASVAVSIEPPEAPLALLERLGPSPFERGGFPVIGFLATTYDKVSRYALTRR